MEFLMIFVVFFICIMIVAIGLSIMNYVFTGFGLMQMGKTIGEKAPWLSWIPYANQFMIGRLGMNNTVGILLVVSNVVSTILGSILGFLSALVEETASEELAIVVVIFGMIVIIYSIAVSVLYYIACHKLFKKFSDKAVLMTVFNVLTSGGIAPIFFLQLETIG